MEERKIIMEIAKESDEETRTFLEELLSECFSVG